MNDGEPSFEQAVSRAAREVGADPARVLDRRKPRGLWIVFSIIVAALALGAAGRGVNELTRWLNPFPRGVPEGMPAE